MLNDTFYVIFKHREVEQGQILVKSALPRTFSILPKQSLKGIGREDQIMNEVGSK